VIVRSSKEEAIRTQRKARPKGTSDKDREFEILLRRAFLLLNGDAKVPDEEWIKTLEDGRKVKFIYQRLPEDSAFITAQLAGNEVVYSVLLTETRNPLSREDVESHFKNELSKK
jgi:hypothetical protein